MFVVDDFDSLSANVYANIYRIADNIEKSQFLIFANSWSNKFDKLAERMMKNPTTIKAE